MIKNDRNTKQAFSRGIGLLVVIELFTILDNHLKWAIQTARDFLVTQPRNQKLGNPFELERRHFLQWYGP